MVTVGSMVGSPVRATMLAALLDRHALTATELARLASVSPASASQHLAKLTASGLLAVERHGRHRYYSVASADVTAALAALESLGAPLPRPPAPEKPDAIREARLCYDHVAGSLGVGITDAMLANGWLEPSGRDYRLTATGDAFLRRLGVDVDGARTKRRLFA
ncbi:MAG: winged helix-turn-helix domain-containing protein, partial [bacterium]|nr:winged helix-turn-helix domain-containing protein [bacterium]